MGCAIKWDCKKLPRGTPVTNCHCNICGNPVCKSSSTKDTFCCYYPDIPVNVYQYVKGPKEKLVDCAVVCIPCMNKHVIKLKKYKIKRNKPEPVTQPTEPLYYWEHPDFPRGKRRTSDDTPRIEDLQKLARAAEAAAIRALSAETKTTGETAAKTTRKTEAKTFEMTQPATASAA